MAMAEASMWEMNESAGKSESREAPMWDMNESAGQSESREAPMWETTQLGDIGGLEWGSLLVSVPSLG